MDCCTILGSSSLRSSTCELIGATVVEVFTIFEFRDGIGTVSPPVELETEAEIHNQMNQPIADVDKHDFPWEVVKVVVVW